MELDRNYPVTTAQKGKTMSETTTARTRRSSRATRAADQAAAAVTAPDSAALTAALTAAGVSEADIATMIKSTQPKPPKMNVKRTIAGALVKAAADLAESWDPAEHDGIERETATQLIASWCSYVPPTAEWDARLGERIEAGGRGSKKAETTETIETAETE